MHDIAHAVFSGKNRRSNVESDELSCVGFEGWSVKWLHVALTRYEEL